MISSRVGHPQVVLGYDYWRCRFGKDSNAVGRTLRIGKALYEIVGVVEEGFTGTETGTVTDLYVPTMINTKAIGKPIGDGSGIGTGEAGIGARGGSPSTCCGVCNSSHRTNKGIKGRFTETN